MAGGLLLYFPDNEYIVFTCSCLRNWGLLVSCLKAYSSLGFVFIFSWVKFYKSGGEEKVKGGRGDSRITSNQLLCMGKLEQQSQAAEPVEQHRNRRTKMKMIPQCHLHG